ncbi:MAG: hypothetical protein ACREC5_02805, partial [Thermoplasmata archaeon]
PREPTVVRTAFARRGRHGGTAGADPVRSAPRSSVELDRKRRGRWRTAPRPGRQAPRYNRAGGASSNRIVERGLPALRPIGSALTGELQEARGG